MSPFSPLIPAIAILLAVLPLIVFWMRMFQDMLENDRLPMIMTRDAKSDWTIIFIKAVRNTPCFSYGDASTVARGDPVPVGLTP